MADFIFAIVVPLASPIQPVAGAFRIFKMVPVKPAVNSSIGG
jgi:hypothetical protein